MIVKEARHPVRKPLRGYSLSGHNQDPAQVSAALRDLAVKAHGLVRTSEDAGSVGCQAELKEVHQRILVLQRDLRAQRLDSLAKYVAALRERVEERLD